MTRTASFPFLGILAPIFITLKLTGYIAWPWVWVLAPMWIPLAIVVVCLLLWLVVMLAVAGFSSAYDR